MVNVLSQFKPGLMAKLGCLTLIATFVGCGATSYEAVPVSGTVMVGGKPAANVFVQFEPAAKSGDDIPSSTAITDAQGKYELKVSAPNGEQGAVVGEHVVRFAPAGDEAKAAMEGPQSYSRPTVRLPREATGGDMRYTVPAEGDTNANFQL
jgi:hypothetical protein